MRYLVIAVVLGGCCPDTPQRGERDLAADAAFHQDPRWLGGDGAYTIDLGGDRTLWLFGDSFIATSPALTRSESTMVRNSVAVMTGRDLRTATMTFAWHDGAPPTSFFAEDGDHWFWPADGTLLPDGSLLIFLSEQRATPGDGLGFAAVGYRAVRVPDPSGPPATWTIEPIATSPAPHDATAAIACSGVDGDSLVALVTDGAQTHHGRLARWPLASLPAGAADPEWWTGSQWIAQSQLTATPAIVLDDIATECSLAYDPTQRAWLHVASRGFGKTTIALRTAQTVTGPWTAPDDLFTPPEDSVANPFVYAGKAHPMLDAHGLSLVVTYADNSFTFADLFDPARAASLYWPHVAEIVIEYFAC